MNSKLKAMLASWARSFIAASAALYSTGETDPARLINAGLAAIVPVVIRFFNKKDPAFGLVAAKVLDVAQTEIAKKAAPKKAAAAKKAPAKKAAAPKN